MFLAGDVGGYDSGGRGPYDDFWYGPVPGKTTSGVRVNDDTAMRLAVLYACVNVISQDIAKVPLMLFRRKDDGSRERVTDHPAIKLLRDPARHITAIDWKQRLQAHQLLRGNAYCEIRTDYRGRIRELYPWKPDNVRVEVMRDESLRYHVRDPGAGTERIYLEGEVHHHRGLSLDGPLGLSPIDQMKETLGEGVAAQQYGSSFFANDARPSIWLEHPSHFKDESQRKDWLSAFKRAFGGANRFSPMLTEYGIKIHDLPPVSHVDLQFIELRKFKNNEICSIFRVPPHKVAILERSTNNNIEHQGIEYVTDCLLTWCRRWEERLAKDLLTDDEREEYYFEFMLDALMRGDAKSRFDAYQSAINSGWMVRNEARTRENLDKLEGLDEPLQPVNMAVAGTVPPPAPAALPSGDAPPDDAQEARLQGLELQARRRVLNRETRALSRAWERASGDVRAFLLEATDFYGRHAEFVAEALAVSAELAAAYCERQFDDLHLAAKDGATDLLLADWARDSKALDFPPLTSLPPSAAQPGKE
jgi:HK97 family phage portal protein